MRTAIFIDEKLLNDYRSPLFPLFSQKIADCCLVTASFLDYHPTLFPVFTDLSDYVSKVISEKGINNYGLVIDAQKTRLDEVGRSLIRRSEFIFVLGPEPADSIEHPALKRASCLYDPRPRDEGSAPAGPALTELDTLDVAYAQALEMQSVPPAMHVLCPPRSASANQWPTLRRWRQKFSQLNINLIYHWPTKAVYDYLIDQCADFWGRPGPALGLDLGRPTAPETSHQPMPMDDFCEALKTVVKKPPVFGGFSRTAKFVNIVCYQPSYLFKDLIDRFVARGGHHSDLPRPEADAYIWMRPQELWHLDFALRGLSNSEIPKAYAKAARETARGLDLDRVRDRSVAIHHGTCHEPIYQFCPYKLAHSLRAVARVFGVCEFEECYGPAIEAAGRDNFEFLPIGFDQRLFTADLIQRETRRPNSPLHIGFVGRAYGTDNRDLLNKSRLAEPRGYRKGGDILLTLAGRLKLAGLNFEMHILGNNWENLVAQLKAVGIEAHYQVRDRDLTYQDYPRFYRNLDLLLITSRCEGGPVSALEALSMGVKVVSSRVGILPWLDERLRGTESVFTYDYDHKWLLFDLDQAVEHLGHIYKTPITCQDRLKTRALIENLTTDHWVDRIYDQAARL